jgi:hypothetical protein
MRGAEVCPRRNCLAIPSLVAKNVAEVLCNRCFPGCREQSPPERVKPDFRIVARIELLVNAELLDGNSRD